jgi:NADPH:quinone reductase
MRAREVRFARRPKGAIVAEDFALAEAELPPPSRGEVLVQNRWISVDPFMRLRLAPQSGSAPNRRLGETMVGGAVGVVAQSRNPGFPEGAAVFSPSLGWRDAYVSAGEDLERVDAGAPLSWSLGVLGLVGVTAYAGVEFVLQPQAGETLYVSAAAGAVGQLVCQLAKRRGCRVLATAGSNEKVRWLREEIGVDAAINYRQADIEAWLRTECPAGLDAYLDSVGGPTLDAALRVMRVGGRVAVCGAISQYNSDNYRRGPEDFFSIVEKGLTVTGFSSRIFRARRDEIFPVLRTLLQQRELKWRETEIVGLENAAAAFVSLFDGKHFGKVVVRI